MLNIKEIKAMLCSLTASTLFGLSFMFTKSILDEVSAFSVMSWRYIIGFVALSICIKLGIAKVNYQGKKIKSLFFMLLYMPILYFVFETYGIGLTSSSESGTIIACIPIVTLVLSVVMLKEMPDKMQVFGILLSTAGVIWIVLQKGSSMTFSALGYILLFGAVLVDSLYAIESRKTPEFNSVEKTYIMCIAGVIFFTCGAIGESAFRGSVKEFFLLPFTNTQFLISVIYLGLACSTLAFLLINYSISIIGPSRASAFAGINTVVSIVSGMIVLHERVTFLQVIATGMILAGVYCVNILHLKYREKINASNEAKSI